MYQDLVGQRLLVLVCTSACVWCVCGSQESKVSSRARIFTWTANTVLTSRVSCSNQRHCQKSDWMRLPRKDDGAFGDSGQSM